MKKASLIALFLALFTTGFSLVGAANSPIQGIVSPEPVSVSNPTKWDVLSSMQKNILPPGTYTETFSEDEMNGLIDAGLSSYKMKWFVSKASVKIGDGYVDLSLHMVRPFRSDVTAKGTVEIVDGVALFRISSVYYGFFPMPASFVERIGNFVMKKKSIDEWLTVKNAQWNNVTFTKGAISFGVDILPEAK